MPCAKIFYNVGKEITMNLNIDISITDAEEFADLWDILDEMITDGDVPQHYRTRLTAIRRAIDQQETDELFHENDSDRPEKKKNEKKTE